MKSFKSRASLLTGTSYKDILARVRWEQKKIEKQTGKYTKRQPYIRSTYFNKDKIFISIFIPHTMQKGPKIQTERFKLYNAAIDLMRNSRCEPETIIEKNSPNVLLHRFYGVTKDGVGFCVQVKQNKRTGRKDFMSVFRREAPYNKKPSAL